MNESVVRKGLECITEMVRINKLLIIIILSVTIIKSILIICFLSPSNMDQWISWIMLPDSRDYVYMADDFSDGHIDSVSFRTPVYPLFILLTQNLLSPRWLLTVLLQQLLVGLTAISCAYTVSLFCRKWVALVAAVVYALSPLGFVQSLSILPDTLLAFLVSVAGAFWLSGYSARNFPIGYRAPIVTGVLLGLATLVKPSVAFLFIAPVVMTVLKPSISKRIKLLVSLIVVASAMMPALAWRAHNFIKFGTISLTSQESFEIAGRFLVLSGRETQETFWLQYIDSVDAIACEEPILLQDLSCTRIPRGWAGLGGGRFCPDMDPIERDRLYREAAVEAFRESPWSIIVGHFTSWPEFLDNPVGNRGNFPLPGIVKFVFINSSQLLQYLLLIGFLFSIAVLFFRPVAFDLILFNSLVVFITGVVTGPLAGPRYSLPFYWSLVATTFCVLFSSMALLGKHLRRKQET
ncbi:MAG: phospholipid carrier-dependent glycosyltransferase [Veillonellaceae bacterium]|nr:phospholipid carrier-dependent glycosyltransferase [Veillonellaceae bacterium]